MIDLVLGVLGTLFGMLAVSILLFMLYIIFDKDKQIYAKVYNKRV